MKKSLVFIGVLIMSFYATISHAIGSVGNNVMALAANVSSLVTGVCFVIGVGLLVGAAVQYKQHRRNKLMTPISKPILMLVLGLVLVCVPLLSHVAPGGEILAQQPYN